MKKLISAILAMALIVQLPACNTSKKTRYEAQFLQLFDTMTEIVAYTETKEEFTNLSNLIYNNLKVYHELYDIYNDYPGVSNIKTINDNAGKKPVKVDKKIIDMLLLGKKESADNSSAFNIALGPVLKIWHQYREAGIDDPENAALPPLADLKEAMKHTDISKVVIDEKASTVYLEEPEMSLDVGGIAKGYATEQVAKIAMEHGYKSALLSVGGNVRAIGDKGVNQEDWNIGIQNPDKESEKKSLCTINIKDESVVTSGIYERYYTVDGKTYHHIIDPKTLMPSTYFKAVTIITPDSGMADIYCKLIFNVPYEQGLAYIRTLPDTEALWVLPDNEIKYSDHFQKYIKS